MGNINPDIPELNTALNKALQPAVDQFIEITGKILKVMSHNMPDNTEPAKVNIIKKFFTGTQRRQLQIKVKQQEQVKNNGIISGETMRFKGFANNGAYEYPATHTDFPAIKDALKNYHKFLLTVKPSVESKNAEFETLKSNCLEAVKQLQTIESIIKNPELSKKQEFS